ncbi:MAG: threonine/serine exporter family protein [Candidatus Cloacimonetes bacterium]|nr:threonine/serine exporter family protein [Candidatus Cloacimonadota bacterium]
MMRPFDLLTLMQFAWAFLAILGFSVRSNLRGIRILFTSLGGGICWASYLIILYYTKSMLLSVFIAIIIVCIYSEVVARLMQTPVSVFVICVIIPLVPGRTLYYAMNAYINGQTSQASRLIFDTLMISGTIAIAIAIVASATQLFMRLRQR